VADLRQNGGVTRAPAQEAAWYAASGAVLWVCLTAGFLAARLAQPTSGLGELRGGV